jgi:hypothetical protein
LTPSLAADKHLTEVTLLPVLNGAKNAAFFRLPYALAAAAGIPARRDCFVSYIHNQMIALTFLLSVDPDRPFRLSVGLWWPMKVQTPLTAFDVAGGLAAAACQMPRPLDLRSSGGRIVLYFAV